MNLGVFLSLGESFSDLKKTGQDQLMLNQNIKTFSKQFDHVYIFTYKAETIKLPQNCTLIKPPLPLHRYIYALLLPFIHRSTLKKVDKLRCFQLSGTVPAILSRIFFSKKFVFNLGYDYQEFSIIEGKPVISWLSRLLQGLAITFCSHVLVKTKTLMPSVSKKFQYKASFLPNGVDVTAFKPKIKKMKSLLEILFVGRLEPQKNLSILIKVIAKTNSKVTLTIVGDGSLRQKIKHSTQVYKLNLKMIRKISHSLMPSVYQAADIFVLPSIKEGSPKALLEAMASGLACIASDIAEHREIISQSKYGILSSIDEKSLSAAIKSLIKSKPIRQQIGHQARNRIIENFNINNLMNQEIAILKST